MDTTFPTMLRLCERVRGVNLSQFIVCEFDDIHEGDIVMTVTMTHSQKYLLKEGYEDYNMIKYGILLQKDIINPEMSTLFRYDEYTRSFTMTNLYKNPGSSGTFILKKIKN